MQLALPRVGRTTARFATRRFVRTSLAALRATRSNDRAIERHAHRQGYDGTGRRPSQRHTLPCFHAPRIAHFILITGMLVVSVLMPFGKSGWRIVNAALLFIVLSERIA